MGRYSVTRKYLRVHVTRVFLLRVILYMICTGVGTRSDVYSMLQNIMKCGINITKYLLCILCVFDWFRHVEIRSKMTPNRGQISGFSILKVRIIHTTRARASYYGRLHIYIRIRGPSGVPGRGLRRGVSRSGIGYDIRFWEIYNKINK